MEEPGSSTDTISLTTRRNQALDILIPISEGHVVIDAPDNGDLTATDNILLYTPDEAGSAISDEFTCAYKYNGTWSLRTFLIKLLDAPIVNNFALDDIAFTPIGKPVAIAVLENDLGDNLNFINHTDPTNGCLLYTSDAADE